MKTLVIYDNTGYIFFQIAATEIKTPQGGINYLELEIPEGKIITGVDMRVTPNVPIFEDIPKTETELLKEQLLATQAQLADIQEQLLLK